ncbi:MAG TPA: hypothetical protein VHP83_26800 [Aggregatilineaceae bacterium]|nr:hypothetical protein [Aggregatilineaceae bacterium]
MDLSELLANIKTRQDLVSFVQALTPDLESDQDIWENDTSKQFPNNQTGI